MKNGHGITLCNISPYFFSFKTIKITRLVLKLKFSTKLKIFVHDRIGEHHPEEEPDLNPDDVKSDLKKQSKVKP